MADNPNVHAVSDTSFDGDILKNETLSGGFLGALVRPVPVCLPIVDDHHAVSGTSSSRQDQRG